MPGSHVFVASSEVEAIVRSLPATFRSYRGPCFSLRFWDGTTWTSSSNPAMFIISFKNERAWKNFCSPMSETVLAGLFIAGDIDVEGSLDVAIRSYRFVHGAVDRGLRSTIASMARWFRGLWRLVRAFVTLNSAQDEQADEISSSIRPERPYEWYRLWLGKSMVFSTGYFLTFKEDLDQAQDNGLDHACNKLQFVKGDRFLDLSCGWGSLLLRAASRYEITAHGFSRDNEQVTATEFRLLEADLTTRCNVHYGSYKDLAKITIPFSKIASLGLSEHVERGQISEYFRCVYGKLREEGLFLADFLTCSTHPANFSPFLAGMGVFEREFPRLSSILDCAEAAGFSVVSVEEMKDHYEETLHLWFRGLAKHRHELARSARRKSVRAWELYIACSGESLRAGRTSLHQILFRKSACDAAEKPPSSNREQRGDDLDLLPDISRLSDRASRSRDRW